jgi:hypothetical protein
MCQLLR